MRSSTFNERQAVNVRQQGPMWVSVDMHRSILGRTGEALRKISDLEIESGLSNGTMRAASLYS
jgi:hypothetical protein